MADLRLLNRFDYVLAESFRQTIRDCAGEIWEANGVVSWASSLKQASPAHANGVMRMNRLMSAREVMGITAGFFRARGHGYTVLVRSDDRALTGEIKRSGWGLEAEHVALVLTGPLAVPTSTKGVDRRRVKNPSGMLDFCATITAAMGSGQDVQRFVNLGLRRIQALLAPSKAAFLAYDEGTAAACALGSVIDGVVFIGWVGTKPEHRRRGLGTSVTEAAVQAGFDQGASLAAALSPLTAVPFLATLGFEEVGRYREYVFPPPN
ncbi:MAG: GNAT family N-acetyltransferase [bacterium]|nr:GNAT family N-acetyltransferase [bacterium]MDE0437206.1 GNAT family N-acetyltransferase [bacterium]